MNVNIRTWDSLDFPPVQSGNILVTDMSGVALYANQGIARRTGFSIPEIIGAKPGQLWGGHMPRSFYRELWANLHAGKSFVGMIHNETKTGQKYEDLLALVPLKTKKQSWYYLALRPPTGGVTRFLQEWEDIFSSDQLRAKPIQKWMSQWFGSREILPSPLSSQESFSHWVERSWILPTTQRFQSRKDDQMLILAAKRETSSFGVLYEKYFPIVYRYLCQHLAGNTNEALDLAQETFYRAFERIHQYQIRNAAYDTYLLRIAHRLTIDWYRQPRPQELSQEITDSSEQVPLAWVWRFPGLRPKERWVLESYYRKGYTLREIGNSLDCSENAAKLLLSRARRKLRKLL